MAATAPLSHGTGDLAMADARRAERDYERQMAEDEAQDFANDEGRRRAIRAAMEAGGHSEEAILDALASLGLRSGGIVSLRDGGRIGLLRGGDPDDYSQQQDVGTFELQQEEGVPIGPMVQEDRQKQLLKAFAEYQAGGGTLSLKEFAVMWMRENAAQGGRIGYRRGNVVQTAASEDAPFNQQRVLKEDLDTSGGVESIWGGLSELEEAQSKSEGIDKRRNIVDFEMDLIKRLREEYDLDWKTADKYASIINFYANSNPLGLSNKEEILEKGYTGNDEIILKELENTSNIQVFAQGGMMGVLPKGKEMDYRGGGVIPIGSRERADDVPARLSKNEFVMTADAVKAAGGGSVNRGAKKMYNLMHNLEARV